MQVEAHVIVREWATLTAQWVLRRRTARGQGRQEALDLFSRLQDCLMEAGHNVPLAQELPTSMDIPQSNFLVRIENGTTEHKFLLKSPLASVRW